MARKGKKGIGFLARRVVQLLVRCPECGCHLLVELPINPKTRTIDDILIRAEDRVEIKEPPMEDKP